MKQIETFNVPENWGDITISNLLHINEIEDTSILSLVKMIRIFNPDKDPLTLSLDSISAIAGEILTLILNPPTQAAEMDSYSVDGIRYRITKPEDINFSQFIDVNTLHTEDYKEQIRNMALIISLLTDNPPKDVREWASVISDNVAVETGMGVLLFFSNGLESFINDTRQSLPPSAEKATKGMTEKARR